MSVRILGLDVSTATGFAVWDYWRDFSSITTGVIELPPPKFVIDRNGKKKPDYHWDDYRVSQMGPKIRNILRDFKPDFVLIEERLRFSKTGDGGFAMTNALHGAIMAHTQTMGHLYGTIYSQSWRTQAYGEGFKQPQIPDMGRDRQQKRDPETGALLFKDKDWGDIAVDKCNDLGISLPSAKAVAHNAAEAALIAICWRHHTRIAIPEKRALDRYTELLQRPKSDPHQRNDRSVAA